MQILTESMETNGLHSHSQLTKIISRMLISSLCRYPSGFQLLGLLEPHGSSVRGLRASLDAIMKKGKSMIPGNSDFFSHQTTRWNQD